jgi:hypothetical protein
MGTEKERIPMSEVSSFRLSYTVNQGGNCEIATRPFHLYVQREGEGAELDFDYSDNSGTGTISRIYPPVSGGYLELAMSGTELLDMGEDGRFEKEGPIVGKIERRRAINTVSFRRVDE